MRITQEADYALRIICLLSTADGILDAGTIAKRSFVTPRFALKILHKLVRGGLVKSFKGAHGGYTIIGDADDITLKRVIELIDGPLAISKCVDDGDCCSMVGADKNGCAIHRVFIALSNDVASKLDRVTISDVTVRGASIEQIIKQLGI